MIIEPRVRQFICTTAHPYGCYQHVKNEVDYVKEKGKLNSKIKNVLVIGSSTGYGLSSRIAMAFGLGAKTIGVHYDKEPSNRRTASAGYYNTQAFEALAEEEGLIAYSVNGDAYAQETKEEVARIIRENLNGETLDVIIYSLASPRRTMEDGTVYTSVIKPIGETYTNKSLNLSDNSIEEASIEPATEEEVEATIKVMGGEDWAQWTDFLEEEGLLSPSIINLSYSYIGPEVTQGIYYSGSMGMAKQDLYKTATALREKYPSHHAHVAINKAVVTQSSTAIPSIALYVSALFQVMKLQGTHEDTIHQMYRLLDEKLDLENKEAVVDEEQLIRLDDWEMKASVQKEVLRLWDLVNTENAQEILDIDGFWSDFYALFGFGLEGVDYEVDIDLLSAHGRNNPS